MPPVSVTLGKLPNPARADTQAEDTDLAPRATRAAMTLAELPLVSLGDGTVGGRAEIEITARLGEGGMGIVDLGRQLVFDRPVAVKRVRADRRSDESVRALLDEARLTGELEHPNIIPAHILGRTAADEPVLVMKRVVGVAWADLARDPAHPAWGDWVGDPLDRHLEILLAVCDAVEYAHRHGVIHRDIKADNVMVGDLGEVYLLDWGVAVRMSDPPSELFGGTLTHMAPEMLSDTSELSRRTDVYLLGATLHEVLTGTPRHWGDTVQQLVVLARMSRPVDYEPSVPSELADICNRATARNPKDRFQTALALAQAIREFKRHRGSALLSDEAKRRLVLLRGEVDKLKAAAVPPLGDGGASSDSRANLRRLSAECIFAFRLALRDWPDNSAARLGLRSCVELMIGFELGERNATGVEVLLAELDGPKEALTRAYESLRKKLADESDAREKLAELKRQSDVFLDQSNGGPSPAILSVLFAGTVFALSALGERLTPGGLFVIALSMSVAALAVGYANWRAFVFNQVSAKRWLATMMLFLSVLLFAGFGFVQETPASVSVQMMAICHAVVAGALGAAFSHVLWVGVPLYIAVAVLVPLRPSDAYFGYGIYLLAQATANRLEAWFARRTARES